MKKIILISSFLTIIDQMIKLIVDKYLMLGESIKIIDNFFYLTYVKNYGAAFSILTGSTLFLIGIGFLALLLIYYFLINNKKLSKIELITYSFLIAGIIGNLLDRIIRGYVIDYLDFKLIGYNFPIFNLADTFIVLSVIIIMYMTLKEEYNGKNNNKRK